MNTDGKIWISPQKKLVHGDLTHAIIGAAMEVLNGIGHGFHEKPYENALVVEFILRGISFKQQPQFDSVSIRGY